MTARDALASIAVFTWVLFIGSLADFHTAEGRTGFALGVVATILAPFAGGWAAEARRG